MTDDLHPLSRLHLANGIMSYVSSPLWVLFTVVTLAGLVLDRWAGGPSGFAEIGWAAAAAAGLFVASMLMIFAPKIYAAGETLLSKDRSQGYGGRVSLTVSILCESALSVLLAPVMALYHTQFVLTTLLGQTVRWSAQTRDEHRLAFSDALASHRSHTLVGIGLAIVLLLVSPDLLVWFGPIIFGLVLSIPFAMLLSSNIGQSVLETPQERQPEATLQIHRAELARFTASPTASSSHGNLFEQLLRDPVFFLLHLDILRASESERPVSQEVAAEVIGWPEKNAHPRLPRRLCRWCWAIQSC